MKIQPFFTRHSLLAFRFAIPPLLIFLTGKCLFEIFAFNFPQLNHHLTVYLSNTALPAISLHESKARLLWLTSVLLYFFGYAGFFTFLWNTLKKPSGSDWLLLLTVALLLSLVEIFYLIRISPANSPINNIFRFSFDALKASKIFNPAGLSNIQYLLGIINLFAIIIVPISILTGSSLVKQNFKNIGEVNHQFTLLKELVQISSAFMVIGIIHMQLWLSWPLSLMTDYDNINGLKNTVAMIIQYWGVCYTLTIAALYLPISIHLRKLAHSFSLSRDLNNNENDSQQWQDAEALFQSTTAKIPQLVAILGPMLVSSISPALTEAFSF